MLLAAAQRPSAVSDPHFKPHPANHRRPLHRAACALERDPHHLLHIVVIDPDL